MKKKQVLGCQQRHCRSHKHTVHTGQSAGAL